jgi:hypothetical protein
MPGKRAAASQDDTTSNWNEIIAKALAYLVMNSDDLKTKNVTERAKFLMGLGLRRKDAAALLGSSDESLRVLLARTGNNPLRAKASRKRRS